jgi:hypothetical protein
MRWFQPGCWNGGCCICYYGLAEAADDPGSRPTNVLLSTAKRASRGGERQAQIPTKQKYAYSNYTPKIIVLEYIFWVKCVSFLLIANVMAKVALTNDFSQDGEADNLKSA